MFNMSDLSVIDQKNIDITFKDISLVSATKSIKYAS